MLRLAFKRGFSFVRVKIYVILFSVRFRVPFMIHDSPCEASSFRELRELASKLLDSDELSDDESGVSTELVKVFLETCILSKKSNGKIVKLFEQCVATSDNSIDFVKKVFEDHERFTDSLRVISSLYMSTRGRTLLPKPRAKQTLLFGLFFRKQSRAKWQFSKP